MNERMDEKLVIDRETFKALAVDTRLNILKLVAKRGYTLTELANILKLQNSTVKEHLDVLLNAGLIKKEDTTRKWKYYSITTKGLRLVQPREVKVLFAFIVTSISALVFGIFIFTRYHLIYKFGGNIENQAKLMYVASSNQMLMTSRDSLINSINPLILLIIFIFLIALSSFLLALFIKKPKLAILEMR